MPSNDTKTDEFLARARRMPEFVTAPEAEAWLVKDNADSASEVLLHLAIKSGAIARCSDGKLRGMAKQSTESDWPAKWPAWADLVKACGTKGSTLGDLRLQFPDCGYWVLVHATKRLISDGTATKLGNQYAVTQHAFDRASAANSSAAQPAPAGSVSPATPTAATAEIPNLAEDLLNMMQHLACGPENAKMGGDIWTALQKVVGADVPASALRPVVDRLMKAGTIKEATDGEGNELLYVLPLDTTPTILE